MLKDKQSAVELQTGLNRKDGARTLSPQRPLTSS